ncbi:site-specific DNA-methyltransferase [Candidatus Heimdallarchaeota archaeon B3_Heim]|nr:MAG: site-specific DNA-methyltransferase [Candidatus Heimdallarchaeota archaeon B3_Heim]
MPLENNQIYNMDCIDGLAQLEKNSIDLLLTDPPFGIDFHKVGTQYNRKQKELGKMYHEVSSEEYYDFTLNWLKPCWEAMKPSASGYIFSGWNHLGDILNALAQIGFRIINHIVWKYQFGVFTKKRFVTSHYHILYFTKLGVKEDRLRTFNRVPEYSSSPGKLYFEDVWRINRDYQKGGEKTPTRLPLAITDKCVRMGSNEGDTILEPFLGSGSVVLSAIKYNRQFIGFELSEKIYQIAERRIKDQIIDLGTKDTSLDFWLSDTGK